MLVYLLVLGNVIFGERTDGFCGGSYLLVVIESGTEVLFWNLHLSIPEGFFLGLVTFSRKRNPSLVSLPRIGWD